MFLRMAKSEVSPMPTLMRRLLPWARATQQCCDNVLMAADSARNLTKRDSTILLESSVFLQRPRVSELVVMLAASFETWAAAPPSATLDRLLSRRRRPHDVRSLFCATGFPFRFSVNNLYTTVEIYHDTRCFSDFR